MSALLLARLLGDPSHATTLADDEWSNVVSAARAERLLASLAHRVAGLDLPPAIVSILDAAIADAEVGRLRALWEAEMARRALAPLGVLIVLLKGTAFVAAGLSAGTGRLIGDLDILVPRDRLAEVEAALLAAGWEWVKPDAYDDAYYRRWMHELPPMIHRDRDAMIDVHHTILPPTARPKPNAALLIERSVALANDLYLGPQEDWGEDYARLDSLRVLSPEAMIVHAAAHLLADGDLTGGLRNLWDIDRLLREFGEEDKGFALTILEDEWMHGLYPHVRRAVRLAARIFGTPLQSCRPLNSYDFGEAWSDKYYRARLLARDGWGRPTRPLLRFAFYLRSHLIRMPLRLLIPHLFRKAFGASG